MPLPCDDCCTAVGLDGRAEVYALEFMPEDNACSDPGIVAAPFVDGSEITPFMPIAGDGKKAFIRLSSLGGLPTTELVDVPQIATNRDFDNLKIKGLQSKGELTITVNVFGWGDDPAAATRPLVPPYLQLMASASGSLYGHLAGHAGGPLDTIATATAAEDYTVTNGVMAAGHVHAVENTNQDPTCPPSGIELVRPQDVDAPGLNLSAAYPGLSDLPNDGTNPGSNQDEVWYSTQAHFERREHGCDTFTMLLHRDSLEPSMMFHGARCTKWNYTANVGEFPTLEMTFQFSSWSTYGDSVRGETTVGDWTGYVGLGVEPAYYDATWPITETVKGAYFAYEDEAGARFTPIITNFSAEWDGGYQHFDSATAIEGSAGLVPTDTQLLTTTITVPYEDSWRGLIGTGSTVSILWAHGSDRGRYFFVSCPSCQVSEDPGFDGEQNGRLAQTLVFRQRNYSLDLIGGIEAPYTQGEPPQNYAAVGVI